MKVPWLQVPSLGVSSCFSIWTSATLTTEVLGLLSNASQRCCAEDVNAVVALIETTLL